MVAKKFDVLWKLEEHTKAKHDILVQYMKAWLPIMSRISNQILYIDAFAGPGEYLNGEPGSPVHFLETIKHHNANLNCQINCLFIEKDPKKHHHLQSITSRYNDLPNVKIRTVCGSCGDIITKVLKNFENRNKSMPTFAFLDPFSYVEPTMDMVKRIMKFPKCEVLINFMYEEANRFLKVDHQAKYYDSVFGTSEWRNICKISDSKIRKQQLHDLYLNQLKNLANINYVRSFEMKNKKNTTKYYLFFGTNSYSGLKKMKEAMWKVDPLSGYTYSDYTDKNQLTLFKPEPDYYQLKRQLVDNFKGKTVPIEKIENFIVVNTPFRETHFKKPILREMEKSNPPEIQVFTKNKKRRPGQYPRGTIIKFI
ncbi:three-Cys-motif partner protein [Desulfohalotomaculum tongense]|uniref:three-Cys-motif partner protein TcmP n=1 Tax=Desulforadius tongensis TaxID=1216062 RepID=UPI001957D9E4|nr:three-Cys-motif partner protein [Desulforadius tongensis]